MPWRNPIANYEPWIQTALEEFKDSIEEGNLLERPLVRRPSHYDKVENLKLGVMNEVSWVAIHTLGKDV